ncbi:helix-turn-helix domain-containing protein [Micromonospora citrea]|uniref:helix-turn-helix domain-containing protein n=1 Tax=Micromonospora citrea TaxID=47855 RepID=UPI000B8834A4|nr:AraC family transcriptional regulator [Micromonospora citrea]
MLSFVDLAARPEFTVTAVTCRDDHRNWSTAESHDSFRVVIVRRGSFSRRAGGVCTDLDPTVAYLAVPGEEERFAHPAGGDVCTSVTLAPALWRSLAGDAERAKTSTVYIDAQLDLAHRRILGAARVGDVDYALTEELLRLINAAVTQAVAGPGGGGEAAHGVDTALVAAARDAIRNDHPAARGLLPLAALLNASPYRLSRAFTRQLGVSLTRYRNRVRVARALDRLEAGEAQLGVLAADLGFADQAHLCRTVRTHVGHTPTALRRLLTQAHRP